MKNAEITLSDIKDKTKIMKAATRNDVIPRIPKKVPSYFSLETMHRDQKAKASPIKGMEGKKSKLPYSARYDGIHLINWEAEVGGPQV